MANEIGEKLRCLRQERGLTQEELGYLVGLQKSAVSKYEHGRIQTPNDDVLRRFCSALGVPDSELCHPPAVIVLRPPRSVKTKPVNLIGVVRISEAAELALHRLAAETGMSLKSIASELIVQAAEICVIEKEVGE